MPASASTRAEETGGDEDFEKRQQLAQEESDLMRKSARGKGDFLPSEEMEEER